MTTANGILAVRRASKRLASTSSRRTVADQACVFESRQSGSGEDRRRRRFANEAIFTKPQLCRELSDRPSVSRRQARSVAASHRASMLATLQRQQWL